MKQIKTALALLLVLLLLSGCGTPSKTKANTDTTPAQTQTTEAPEPAPQTTAQASQESDTSAPSGSDPTEAPEPAEIQWEALPALRRAKDGPELLSALTDCVYDRMSAYQTEACGGEDIWDEPIGDGGVEQVSPVHAQSGVAVGGTAVTDGETICQIDDYGLWILRAGGAQSEILSYTPLDGTDDGSQNWLQEVYIHENRALVIYVRTGTDSAGEGRDSTQTHVCVFDISDGAQPVQRSDLGLDGTYQRSCLIGGQLYLMTSRYFWAIEEGEDPEGLLPQIHMNGETSRPEPDQIWLSPSTMNAAITTVAAVSAEDGSLTDLLCSTDAGFSLCASEDCLYLARPVWSCGATEPQAEGVYQVSDQADRMQTELRQILLGPDGTMEQGASCLIDGAALATDAMDLHDGVLRIACSQTSFRCRVYTDESKGFRNCEPGGRSLSARVVTLDRDLRVLGSLEGIAEGSNLTWCRFSGGYGWYFTAEDQNTVHWLDLSDPNGPKAGAASQLPAVTRRMQPLADGRLLCFVNPGAGEGVQISLLDLRDPAQVRVAAQAEAVEQLDSSVTWEPSALCLDEAAGRFCFPVENEGKPSILFYTLGEDRIDPAGSVEVDFLPYDARFLSAGGLVYYCSPGVSYVIDPDTATILTTLTEAVG